MDPCTVRAGASPPPHLCVPAVGNAWMHAGNNMLVTPALVLLPFGLPRSKIRMQPFEAPATTWFSSSLNATAVTLASMPCRLCWVGSEGGAPGAGGEQVDGR
eukprot:360121-Chlamydomonas_euryale.AAC.16